MGSNSHDVLLYCAGVRPELTAFVADRNPAKQGKYLPGGRMPNYPPEALVEERLAMVVILPWNTADEAMAQMASAGVEATNFLTVIPELRQLQ